MAVQEYQYPNSFAAPGPDAVLDADIIGTPADFDVTSLPPGIDVAGGWFVVGIDTAGVREWILVSAVSGSGPYTFTIGPSGRGFGASVPADHATGDPVYLELIKENLVAILQGQIHTPNTLLLPEKATPATPDTGLQELYIDSTTHHVTRKDDGGFVTDLETGGGGGSSGYIHVRDEKISGTDGGTFTNGTWRTRTLNTEVSDTGSDCSLASNQMTLSAGTYRFRAWAPAFSVAGHRLRLQNISDSTTIIVGSSTYAPSGVQTHAFIMGMFTLASSKILELQHLCETTQGTNGLGAGGSFAGEVEVFASIELEKVA